MNVGPVGRVHFARFAAATNDFNPVHVDDDFARTAGLPSVVGSGLLAVAVIAETLGERTIGRRLSVRFKQPILPGAVLACEPAHDGSCEVRTQDGQVVAVGRVDSLPPAADGPAGQAVSTSGAGSR
ncbi:MAG: MaoC/PaaZ C-terminal domain-containing protein [Actinomycetota bacterium]